MGNDGQGREKGMFRIFLFGARLALLGTALLFAASCAVTMKGYPGPSMPDTETALIKTGFYSKILRCDDIRLVSPYLNIVVLPGKHTVEVAFRKHWVGNKLLLSVVTGTITFVAEGGHTYSVNAQIIPHKQWADLVAHEYDWQGYVKDLGTGQTVAVTTEALPIRVDWIYQGALWKTAM
jgi:hypothetical protein